MALAFVFPGQGSQSVGMLAQVAAEYDVVESTFAQASQALDFDLWALVRHGPEAELNRTANTQPAMLTAGVAMWRVWRANQGALPAYMAGHSLGEYTALVCAKSLVFADAVRVVADRGRFMQEAVPVGEGSMAAIMGLDDSSVIKLCEHVSNGEVLSAVNFNAPGQVVIAGTRNAVERAVSQAKAAGAQRAVTLPVSAPFHCALMHPAAERMAARLQEVEFHSPKIPVIHNTHVEIESEPEAIRKVLVAQVDAPVRWVETIEKMGALGIDTLIECGPGKVLSGLNKRIARNAKILPTLDPKALEHALSVAGGGT